MAKLSRATKETIKTILVVLLVLLVVVLYVVYPLNRTKATMGRADMDTFVKDSLPKNDPSAYLAEGWQVDTFKVEGEGVSRLACLHIQPNSGEPIGLAIVIPDERKTRDSVIPMVREFLTNGYAVVTYDQRASGRSTGKYHSDGQLEALDLEALISHLDIHKMLRHPLVVVGYKAGADAALLAAQDEPRIDALAAVDPYLTTGRLVDDLRSQRGMLPLPFFRTVYWWWYKMRSGYAIEYRDEKVVRSPGRPAVVLTGLAGDAALERLKQESGELVTFRPVSTSIKELAVAVLARASGK